MIITKHLPFSDLTPSQQAWLKRKVIDHEINGGPPLCFGFNGDIGLVVALKPIADWFGMDWAGQREKVTKHDDAIQGYGTCQIMVVVPTAVGVEQPRLQTCISAASINDFLRTLDVARVRRKAGDIAADWLALKIEALKEAA